MKGQKLVVIAVLAALLVAVGAFTGAYAADDDSTFRVVNNTHHDVQVEVYSRADIPYGVNDENDNSVQKIFIVPAGGSGEILLDNDETYYYAYLACGNTVIDGAINMEEDVEIIILPCATQPTVMEVNNHLGVTVSLELIGYEEKTYDIEPGYNLIEVYSGETIYKYDACDTDFNGVVDILASGRTDFFMRSCEWFDAPERIYGEGNVVRYVIVNHASFPIVLSMVGPASYLVTLNPGENSFRMVAGVYDYSYYLNYQLTTGSFFVRPTGSGRLMLSPSYTIDYNAGDEFE